MLPSSEQSALKIEPNNFIIGQNDPILITGATGFIGTRVVENLLRRGFRNIRCFARPSTEAAKVAVLSLMQDDWAGVQILRGNLLSRSDCVAAVKDVAIVYHLAAGRGEKSFPDAYMNSVVTTRNLLEACVCHSGLKRFVNISSFADYSNKNQASGSMLDERSPVETHPELRGDAYCFAKAKQDEIVREYAEKYKIPFVMLKPGHVYGPGNLGITGRVGIGTFGLFLHLGGSNLIPFTYVDNCAEAIVLAGLRTGIDGEVFNVVDDDLPSSRQFLRSYKRNVKHFRSLYVPHAVSYFLCYLWERYSSWSEGQLPPAFNRRRWRAFWKKTRYTNEKLKTRVGWVPAVPMSEGLRRYFEACRTERSDA